MATNADTFDALIVGGGPAGLGAALALCRQNHRVIIFDSELYRNRPATEMHMVATWDHRSPKDFIHAARSELSLRYGSLCTIVTQEVVGLAKKPDITFEARDAAGNLYKGRKVVFASGSRDIFPDIDGFEECWGRVMLHCLLCKGFEQLGTQKAGILAIDEFAEPSTVLRVLRSTKQLASQVCIYTNGNDRVAAQLREVAALVPGTTVEAAVVERLEMVSGDGEKGRGLRIHFEEGTGPQDMAFAVYHPGTEQACPLPEQLGVDLDENGDIKLGAFQETSQHGIFAAGDCASAHKYVSTASAMGFMAGAGVGMQLQSEHKF